MPCDPFRSPGQNGRAVTVQTPGGPVVLTVPGNREATALALVLTRFWPALPPTVIGPHPARSRSTETGPRATESTRESTEITHREHPATEARPAQLHRSPAA